MKGKMTTIPDNMRQHPLVILSKSYPQLLLPVEKDSRGTDAYRDAVLCGNIPDREPCFSLCEGDTLTVFATPAGEVEILYLEDRTDFEHAVRALAYRCEPEPVPASMGAVFLSGLINWEKIHCHLRQYEEAGGTDSDGEFRSFTAEKSNYLDSLLLLSAGEYSAVPAEKMGLEPSAWREKSLTIRKFHELTHFYCRKRYPENKEALRDELVADLIGLKAAFGAYDPYAAALFLGIEEETYRKGGRLENYIGENQPENFIRRAREIIGLLAETEARNRDCDCFQLIDLIEKTKLAL